MRGTAAELMQAIPDAGLRGEIVVLFGHPQPVAADEDALRAALGELLAHMPVKQAAAEVAGRYGLPRREVYALALEIKREAE